MFTHYDGMSGIKTVRLTRAQALACSEPGRDASAAIAATLPHVEFLADDQALRRFLSEYGAWDDLAEVDTDTLCGRALWIAAGDIRDNPEQYGE